jgi:hypothetical protein
MYPTLVADLNRATSIPQSAYAASPLEPQIPRAYDKLYAEYMKIAARIQAMHHPASGPNRVSAACPAMF